MKKKLLIAFLAITLVFSLAFAFTACFNLDGGNDEEGKTEHTHRYSESVVEATCTKKGYKLFACDCGYSYKEEIPTTAHLYETQNVIIEATCTEEGLIHKKCKTCGTEIDEKVAVLQHKPKNYPEQSATCIQAGYTGGKYCEICKEVLEERTEVPATGIHNPVDYEDKQETCGEAGYQGGKYCSVCETVLEERTEIPATGNHTEVKDPAVDATCSDAGHTAGSHCSVCGNILIESNEIPKIPHSYQSEVISQPAYQVKGIIKYTCSVCDFSYEEEIPALTYQPSDIWTGNTAEGFESGEGTLQSPYIIKTAAQLKYFADSVYKGDSFMGKFVKLSSDIILNDTTDWRNWAKNYPQNFWTPIGKFCGNFDGDNYSVKGLFVKSQSGYGGLFGQISNARISNLTVCESYIIGDGGGIIGHCDEYDSQSFIQNCTFSGVVEGKYIAGGIIGYGRMGALQGVNTIHTGFITLNNCSNLGFIKTSMQLDRTDKMFGAGGLIGYANVYSGQLGINNCSNEGKINAVSGAGGLVGRLAYGSATYQFKVGIESSFNKGEIEATDLCAGGLAGYLWLGNNLCEVNIQNCFNTASVKANDAAGGLVATFSTGSDSTVNIEKCYNTGNIVVLKVPGNYSNVGGLFGMFSVSNNKQNYKSAITGCFNSGTISGVDYAGGLIGYTTGTPTIDSCYNSGSITGGQSVGGIVGHMSGGSSSIADVNNAYNTGNIKGQSSVGGIVGSTYNSVWLNYCYNVGEVIGTEFYVGAIIGDTQSSDEANYCYYLKGCAKDGNGKVQLGYGLAENGIWNYYDTTCIGYSNKELKLKSIYNKFDFTKVWIMPADETGGYPVLRNVAIIEIENH